MDNMTIQQAQSLSQDVIYKVIKKALQDKAEESAAKAAHKGKSDADMVKDILSGYEGRIFEAVILTVRKALEEGDVYLAAEILRKAVLPVARDYKDMLNYISLAQLYREGNFYGSEDYYKEALEGIW